MFPLDAQVMIYRIFQETLTNVGKPAEARQVIIRMGNESGFFSFTVKDDGKGFDVKKTRETPGQKGPGLITMVERSRVLGGSLKVESEMGKGTRVTFTLPIKQENVNDVQLSARARG